MLQHASKEYCPTVVQILMQLSVMEYMKIFNTCFFSSSYFQGGETAFRNPVLNSYLAP